MTYPSDKRGGFTLIELVLVLALLALAASVTALSVGRTSQRALIRNEASRLQGELRHARTLSLYGRRPVSFLVDARAGEYAIMNSTGEPLSSHEISPRLKLSGSEEIVFFPRGDSTGGSLLIADAGGRSYYIEVDRVTGIARLQRL